MVSDPKHSTGPGSVALIEAARFCEERLRAYRLNILARVRESDRAFDFALGSAAGLPNVVRCVLHIEPSDYRDLQTMLLQGDFNRAFLVYTADGQAHLSDEIQSYPLTRVDELAASLA